MDEPFLGYTKGRPSHNNICKNPGCLNKIKNSSDLQVCQSCSDKWKLSNNFTKIYGIEDAITRKKEELRNLEEKLHIEKIQIKYEVDLVSDDVRVHQGFSSDSRPMKLETHCTIIRVKDSPENVYFGHVTLVISNNFGKKYKWHYGAEVVNKKIPKNLRHVFWYYKNKEYDPEETNVNDFANFPSIPDNTTLAKIMKHHFKECVTFFRTKTQWPNQVWYPNDKIKINSETEIATDLVDRLIQMKDERKKIDYDAFSIEHREQIKAQRKAAKEIKRQEKQEQVKRAVELAIQQEKQELAIQQEKQELARKADQLTQTPNYMSQEILSEAKRQEAKRQETEAEQNEKNKELERIRIAKFESEKLAKQQEKERQETLNFETQKKMNDTLATRKAIVAEINRNAKKQKKIDQLNKKRADDEALNEALAKKAKEVEEKKETGQPSTSILHNKHASPLEIKVKNKVKKFLEDIKETEKDINMENRLTKEEGKDPMSDISFNLRLQLSYRYKLLIEHIEDIMNNNNLENEINKHLKESDKMEILQTIRNRKKNLQTLFVIIFKKDTICMIDEWENYYNKNILPLEEELKTLINPVDEDRASELRRMLIPYYRDGYKNKSLEWDRLELKILSEEDANIIRRKMRDLNTTVDAETRSKDLSKVEAEYLNLLYKELDDTFDEPNEQIIEYLRILNPKFSDINFAKQIVENAKQKSFNNGKKVFSTTTLLSMYPKLYDPRLFE